jgi:hypothetical protein
MVFSEKPDWRRLMGSSAELCPPKYGSFVELDESAPFFHEVEKPLEEMFVRDEPVMLLTPQKRWVQEVSMAILDGIAESIPIFCTSE